MYGNPILLNYSEIHSLQNGTPNLVPVLKTFENTSELLSSRFWKNLQIKRNPQVTESTVIYIKDTKSTFYFDQVEFKETAAISTIPSWWSSKSRDVHLIEVQYGKAKSAMLNNFPISLCLSANVSSAGGSYIHAYEFENEIKNSIGPGISTSIGVVGVSLDASTSIGLQINLIGTIKCNVAPGKKSQVIANIGFKYFPSARKRLVVINDDDIMPGVWKAFNEDEPEYEDLGPVYFDTNTLTQHQCVTKPAYLRCDDFDQSTEMTSKDGDLRRVLKHHLDIS